jgi:bifunctional non-homologous end joining protein LigD
MASATRSPVIDERHVPATSTPIEVAGVTIPRRGNAEVDIDGRRIALTNLERSLYPDVAFTKADSVAYHLSVAAPLLDALRERALTVGRFPGGVLGRGFAQTEIPGRPSWVRSVPIQLANGTTRRFTLVDERATLVWLVQMGAIELHTFLGLANDLARPTATLFDLDPTEPAGLLEAAEVALLVRQRLASVGIEAAAKTSGSAGIHVLAPAGQRTTFDETRALAVDIAAELAHERPDLVCTQMHGSARIGRVLIDTRQNSMRLTTIVPYSLRAARRPTVSTPVTWDELSAACERRDERSIVFTADEAARRIGSP